MRIPRENGHILILKNSQKFSCPPTLYKTLRVLVSDFPELQDMDLWIRNYQLSLISSLQRN